MAHSPLVLMWTGTTDGHSSLAAFRKTKSTNSLNPEIPVLSWTRHMCTRKHGKGRLCQHWLQLEEIRTTSVSVNSRTYKQVNKEVGANRWTTIQQIKWMEWSWIYQCWVKKASLKGYNSMIPFTQRPRACKPSLTNPCLPVFLTRYCLIHC